MEPFDGLDLDDYPAVNQDVELQVVVRLNSAIEHRNMTFKLKIEFVRSELDDQTIAIDGLE
jgi:hypothetical protein